METETLVDISPEEIIDGSDGPIILHLIAEHSPVPGPAICGAFVTQTHGPWERNGTYTCRECLRRQGYLPNK